MSLPNSFIIGVQKAGTTSLHNWLSQHPDIFAPEEYKDVDYFASTPDLKKAKKCLLQDYSGHKDESVILHTYVNYIIYEDALKRIHSLLPDAKIVVILRDPIDRAISAYKYFKKMGQESRDIQTALFYEPQENLKPSKVNNDLTYLEHGMYGKQLYIVLKYFAPSNVFVTHLEKLKNNPNELIKELYSFLGVDPGFNPQFKKKNETGIIKNKWIHEKLTKTSQVRQLIIKYFIDWWLPVHKRQLIRKQLIDFNTKDKKRNVDSTIRRELKNRFEDDQKILENILEELDSV